MQNHQTIPPQKIPQNLDYVIQQVEQAIASLKAEGHPCPDAEQYLLNLKEAVRRMRPHE